MIYTTLEKLRCECACFKGYNRLVRHLQGREFTAEDDARESYIPYRHEEPIGLDVVLESNGLDDALWSIRASDCSDRDARMFAVWCARQVEHLTKDEQCRKALDVAERFANGEATEEELEAARVATWEAAEAAAEAAAWEAARAATWALAGATTWGAAGAAAAAWEAAGAGTGAAQKGVFLKMINGEAPWQG